MTTNSDRNIIWSPWNEPGSEHLHLVQDERGFLADGMILRVKESRPIRAHYRIRCDLDWKVQKLEVNLLESFRPAIRLQSDGNGHWTDEAGNPLAELDGCLDVDISITPFTNTLPIRRMSLKPGESSEIIVAYISLPEMNVQRSHQRYTCLDVSPTGGNYKYEDQGLFQGFSADLQVDADGLVLDYPELFRRVWSDELFSMQGDI
ncbi:MAG: putative glycolipid-binding domain-containing protein [Anaerolineaceae bacterium]|nr:putative glycolipid-binding domain-containing protein [Anaerolineaceae bacterium]